MGCVLAVLTAAAGQVLGTERCVETQSQVAFRQLLRADIADEGEAVTVLEVGSRNDVPFESRCRQNSVVTTIAQRKDKL